MSLDSLLWGMARIGLNALTMHKKQLNLTKMTEHTCAKINHYVLVTIEEHHCTWVVQFVHFVEVRNLERWGNFVIA